MDWFLLSKHSISSLAQFVLSLLITGYLLTIRRKSVPTWLLIGFFSAFTVALLCSFLLVATQSVYRPVFGAAQAILGGVYVVIIIQFAYWFPTNPNPRESRIVLWVSTAVAAALVWIGATNLRTDPTYALLVLSFGLGVLVVWAIIVFLRQSAHYALGTKDAALLTPRHSGARNARAHRSFAWLVGLLLVLSLSSVLEGADIISLETLISIVAALYLWFLIAFVFVYINNAPVPSTFLAKLVGVPLVTMLAVVGVMGNVILGALEQTYDTERRREQRQILRGIVEENDALIPEGVRMVTAHPIDVEGAARVLYTGGDEGGRGGFGPSGGQPFANRDDALRFHRAYVEGEFTPGVLDHLRANTSMRPNDAKELMLSELNRTDLIRLTSEFKYRGTVQDLRCSIYYFTMSGFLFEAVYAPHLYPRYIHSYAVRMAGFLVGATLVMLVGFPYIFKGGMDRPLQSLLTGMREVNGGNTDVAVPIYVEDEFGELTHSFNGMVDSIRRAEAGLRRNAEALEEANRTLEQRVDERTRDLNEKNDQLETAIVDLQAAQNQLVVQEKMVSLGQLVAGLAHEINNPVGAINASTDVVARCVDQVDSEVTEQSTIEGLRISSRFGRATQLLRDNIGVLGEAGDRIARIVRTLRNFVRLDEAAYQVASVEEGLESTIALMRTQIQEGVEVTTSFAGVDPIPCSPGELNQVFMNLIRKCVRSDRRHGGHRGQDRRG